MRVRWHCVVHRRRCARPACAGWLGHIQILLSAAQRLACTVHGGSHALVHCSDGWDRTAQISALSQLLLDPCVPPFHTPAAEPKMQ
jgi:hypothetical protein